MVVNQCIVAIWNNWALFDFLLTRKYQNIVSLNTLSAWCPLKGHTYLLNKAATESCKFVQVCMTFYWTPDVKGINENHWKFITLLGCSWKKAIQAVALIEPARYD